MTLFEFATKFATNGMYIVLLRKVAAQHPGIPGRQLTNQSEPDALASANGEFNSWVVSITVLDHVLLTIPFVKNIGPGVRQQLNVHVGNMKNTDRKPKKTKRVNSKRTFHHAIDHQLHISSSYPSPKCAAWPPSLPVLLPILQKDQVTSSSVSGTRSNFAH